MAIYWMILGAAFASAIWLAFTRLQVKGKLSVGSWALILVSLLWGAFTASWIVSSLAEGESQAAGMGLLIFGALLLMLILITKKKITVKSKSQSDSRTVSVP